MVLRRLATKSLIDLSLTKPPTIYSEIPCPWSGLIGQNQRWLAQKSSRRLPYQGYSFQQQFSLPKPVSYKPDSVGMIGDPYKGPERWITPLDFFHPNGWTEIGKRVRNSVRDFYSLYLCRKHLKDFKYFAFKKEAFELYKKSSEAIAIGNIQYLRKMVTLSLLSELKSYILKRKKGGWKKIQWSLSPTSTGKVKFIRARVLGIPDNKYAPAFIQCTLLFQNRQKFAAFDQDGKIIAGSQEMEINVEDCWVFERLLNKDSFKSKWKVAARLVFPTRS